MPGSGGMGFEDGNCMVERRLRVTVSVCRYRVHNIMSRAQ